MASAKQPYRLARSRADPKGRPGAKRSGRPGPWEWRKEARPSATEKLLFALQSRAPETEKQAGQVLMNAGPLVDESE